ncbi:hypothetical protein [Streptomyces sp. BP-8]|uniref:Uncharacterized protein n=1 Tax=Streptomyces sirii TaxID=3127701 RepID=A0ABZ2QKR6_9ACTN
MSSQLELICAASMRPDPARECADLEAGTGAPFPRDPSMAEIIRRAGGTS